MHTFISNTCPAQQAGQAVYNEADDSVTPFLGQIKLAQARARFLRDLIDHFEFDGGFCREIGNAREAVWSLQNQLDELEYSLLDVPHFARTLVYEREMAKIEGDSK